MNKKKIAYAAGGAAVMALLVLLLSLAALTSRYFRADALALKAFRESRSPESRFSDYDMITRGIVEGMSFNEVRQHFTNADQLAGLVPNRSEDGMLVSEADSKDAWLCFCVYAYNERLDAGPWNYEQIYIMETYWIVFDENRRAAHINYELTGTGPSAGHGIQRVRVNLHDKTISEPLRLKWKE